MGADRGMVDNGEAIVEITKWLAFSDIHIPHHDPEAVEWVREQIAQYKPAVVINCGDLFDARAASRWPKDFAHVLAEEYAQAGDILAMLRKSAPSNARYIWLHGNHEDNILAEGRLAQDVRGLLHWDKHIAEAKQWEQLPYRSTQRGVFRIGQVTFRHGFSISAAGIKREAVVWGRPWGLMVSGHTHRPHAPIGVEVCGIDTRYSYANTGCLLSMTEPLAYMRRHEWSKWGQAIVLGESMPLKSPREGRYWRAETRVRNLVSDTDTSLWKCAYTDAPAVGGIE